MDGLSEILITGIFRTLIELLPFLTVLVLELKGKRFEHIYRKQFDMVDDAEILPSFTEPDKDDVHAIEEIARFSVAKHDTIKYTSYSFVVITVIIYAKIPTIVQLNVSDELKIAIFLAGVILWSIAVYIIYAWRTRATTFYESVSPFDYFRDPDHNTHRRIQSIPLVGEISLLRHRADLLLINGVPILLVLIANSFLITIQINTIPVAALSS